MRVLTTSVTALATAALFAATGATAFACDFHTTHVTAQASPETPAAAETVEATKVDPRLLAYLERLAAESETADEIAETE